VPSTSTGSDPEGLGPGSNFVGHWIAWRMRDEALYASLEEHFKSGNYLHSRMGLAKLFLDKLDIWETEGRFHNPWNPYFIKVIA